MAHMTRPLIELYLKVVMGMGICSSSLKLLVHKSISQFTLFLNRSEQFWGIRTFPVESTSIIVKAQNCSYIISSAEWHSSKLFFSPRNLSSNNVCSNVQCWSPPWLIYRHYEGKFGFLIRQASHNKIERPEIFPSAILQSVSKQKKVFAYFFSVRLNACLPLFAFHKL